MKTENKNSYIDTIYLAIGEAIVSLLVLLIYLAIGKFDWTVITGVILGSLATIANFVILSIALNKALDKFIDMRGDKELSEEEAEAFAKANSIKVQNAVTKSYVFRTGLMMGSLVIAFITKWFNPIATLVPLAMYKPLLYVTQFTKQKRGE
jgi:hypothetical protein